MLFFIPRPRRRTVYRDCYQGPPRRQSSSITPAGRAFNAAGLTFLGLIAIMFVVTSCTPFQALCVAGVVVPLVALGVIGRVMQNRDERRRYVPPPPLVPKRPPPPPRPQSYWSNRR